MRKSIKGVLSGENGGGKIYHQSVASLVRIERTYPQEVEQGVVEDVTVYDLLDYEEVIDLYKSLQKAAEGNLKWLLNK
jgi:hypothetical protein